MYSNKENINILTALLIDAGVRHAVVCPGSRNAPIVHNLNECGRILCHPVTDERSAGFHAIGISQATDGMPVVVCVTSGSALLNLAPAVAEAHYQHVPLIVVSADRPPQWIDQLDGQTLPQPGALGVFVRRCVSLPEPTDDEQRWYCRRLVSEALYEARRCVGAPVHINVPITEPLFVFDTEALPEMRLFQRARPTFRITNHEEVLRPLYEARRPMIVIGQTPEGFIHKDTLKGLSRHVVVLREALGGEAMHFDEVIEATAGNTAYMPDHILYIGGTLVSKRLKRFLRASGADTSLVSMTGNGIQDPLMHLTNIVECTDADCLNALLQKVFHTYENGFSDPSEDIATETKESRETFRNLWSRALGHASQHAEDFVPQYSQMAAVRYFEQQLEDMDYTPAVHYANSTAVRLANIWSARHVWCNRGVNGIEGSLSVAAGFSTASDDMVFCVIGDLSFFYDQNALWNDSLKGNLRIILLNNHGGGIFRSLKGLKDSGAAERLVYAGHNVTAQGICTQNDIGYMAAHDMAELHTGMVTLLTRETERPMLLEVFTDAGTDNETIEDYFKSFTNFK